MLAGGPHLLVAKYHSGMMKQVSKNEVKMGMDLTNSFQEPSKWSVVSAKCFKHDISSRIL